MELHQLRYMIAVAEQGTFSKAARDCHVSQPSLSNQIIKLEAELGEKLFHRTKRRAVPTPAGQAFLAHARTILDELRIARQEVLEFGELERGTVTVGVLPTIAPYFFAGVISEFNRKFRNVEVVISEDTTNHLVQGVESGALELAVLAEPVPSTSLLSQRLFTEPLLVALPKDHHTMQEPFVRMDELETASFILMREEHCLSRQTLEVFHRAKFRPNVVCQTSQIETVIALVEAGVGISLIPEMALSRIDRCRIQVKQLHPSTTRTIVFVRRPDRELCQATLQFCRSLMPRQGSAVHL
jgi:LysR family transcriptional regulator, hydrogen peroxide-inducible genes activator